MGHLREKKGNYYAEFYDPQRQPKRKWVTLRTQDKAAAQSRLSDLQRQYSAGSYDPWQDPSELSISLSQAHERFLKSKDHLAEASLDKYDLVLRQLTDEAGGETSLLALRPEDFEAVYFRDSLSDYSKHTYFSHLRAFCNWALDEGYLKDNPLESARTPRQVKRDKVFLMPEDMEELLSTIEADMLAEGKELQWLIDIVKVATTTGLRLAEITSMTWDWVDLRARRLTIRTDEFSSKSGHEESVPLVADAMEVLERRYNDDASGHVFEAPRSDRDQIGRSHVTHTFKRYVRKAGLDDRISFHSLRHTCASWLVMRGVPLPVVQKILRHSSISVTEGYAHLAPDVIRGHMEEAFETSQREGKQPENSPSV